MTAEDYKVLADAARTLALGIGDDPSEELRKVFLAAEETLYHEEYARLLSQCPEPDYAEVLMDIDDGTRLCLARRARMSGLTFNEFVIRLLRKSLETGWDSFQTDEL